MSVPTDECFRMSMRNLPHGFVPPTTTGRAWFEQHVNSDIRQYYKLVRRAPVSDYMPVGQSGITAGELALYIIRDNPTKRCRRY